MAEISAAWVLSQASMFEQIATGKPAPSSAVARASIRADRLPSSSPIVVGCSRAEHRQEHATRKGGGLDRL